jgi:ATP-dependent Lon protease
MDTSGFTQHPDTRLFLPAHLTQGRFAAEESEPPKVAVEVTPAAGAVSVADMFPPSLIEPLDRELGVVISLFDADALREAYERNRTQGPRNKSDRDLVQSLLRRLFTLGTLRRCGLPVRWNGRLEQLKRDHPNCSEVVEFVQREFSLSEISNQPPRLPAILLNGPPGCGKTYFAEALAKVMGTGFLRVNLETGQTSSELTGTAAHWGNSQPGRLFDLMMNGLDANPVVLLDEIDKAGGHRDYRIDKALYALLDPASSAQWADASLPSLKLNLAHVTWLLTSNEWQQIPVPLLSRMQVFHVREPSRAEAVSLARRIFELTALEFQRIEFSVQISTSLVTMLALYPARVVQRLSRALIAAAVRDQRNAVEAKDFATVGADRVALEAFLATGCEPSRTKH